MADCEAGAEGGVVSPPPEPEHPAGPLAAAEPPRPTDEPRGDTPVSTSTDHLHTVVSSGETARGEPEDAAASMPAVVRPGASSTTSSADDGEASPVPGSADGGSRPSCEPAATLLALAGSEVEFMTPTHGNRLPTSPSDRRAARAKAADMVSPKRGLGAPYGSPGGRASPLRTPGGGLAAGAASWFQRSQYIWLGGARTVGDSAGALVKSVLAHNLHVMALALVMALAMIPVVFLHHEAHVAYLEQWQSVGGDTTQRSDFLGPPEMFRPTGPLGGFASMWAGFYSISGLSSALAGVCLWVGVITRFKNTWSMYGWSIGWLVVFPAYVFLCFLGGSAANYAVKRSLFTVPSFLAAVISIGAVGAASRVHLRFKRVGWFMGVQTAVNAIVFWLYLSQLPKWFLSVESEWERLFIRLVVHPLMFEAVNATHRMAAMMYPDHLSEKRLSVFVIPTIIVANLLGRFLVSNMATSWGTITLTVLLGLQEVIMRLTTPYRDYTYCLLAFKFRSTAAEKIAFSPAARHIKGDVVNLEVLAEFFGIFVAPGIVYVYRMQVGGVIPSWESMVFSTVFQFVTEWIVDLAPCLVVLMGHRRLMKYLDTNPGVHHMPPIVEADSEEEDEQQEGPDDKHRAGTGGDHDPVLDMEGGALHPMPKFLPVGSDGPAAAAARGAGAAGAPLAVAVARSPGDAPGKAWGSFSVLPLSPLAKPGVADSTTNDTGARVGAVKYAPSLSGPDSEDAGAGREQEGSAAEGKAAEGAGGAKESGAGDGAREAAAPKMKAVDHGPAAAAARGFARWSQWQSSMYGSRLNMLALRGSKESPKLPGEGLGVDVEAFRSDMLLDLQEPAAPAGVSFVRALKATTVTTLNCWDVRFKHFELVVLGMMLGWTSYFLRSFFYPGSAMCAVQDADGWTFGVCGSFGTSS